MCTWRPTGAASLPARLSILRASWAKAAASPADDMAAAQVGESADPKTAAVLRFALALVDERGQVGDAAVRSLRSAGFDDEHIVEIVAHVALNLFTNYVNVAFAVPVDFPTVELRRAA